MGGRWLFHENDIRAETLVEQLRQQGVTADIIPPDWGKPMNGIRLWLNDEIAEKLGLVVPARGTGTPCMEDFDG